MTDHRRLLLTGLWSGWIFAVGLALSSLDGGWPGPVYWGWQGVAGLLALAILGVGTKARPRVLMWLPAAVALGHLVVLGVG